MFYQEALPKFRLLSCVDSLLTIGDRKVAATFEKAESANSLPFAVPFHVGAYFCMGVYKRDVVVVIKMVPIFMGCLFCVGAYYPDFTVYVCTSFVSDFVLAKLAKRPGKLYCLLCWPHIAWARCHHHVLIESTISGP